MKIELKNSGHAVCGGLAMACAMMAATATAETVSHIVQEWGSGHMGGFSTEADHWSPNKAPSTNGGADDFLLNYTTFGLTPSTARVGYSSMNLETYPLSSRTFGGKSLTINQDPSKTTNAQLINGTECAKSEEEATLETATCFYAAVFPNDGLILKRGRLSMNWQRWGTYYAIIGGKVTVATDEDIPFIVISDADLADAGSFFEYRFLGEASGDEHAHMKVDSTKAIMRLAFTNCVNYVGTFTAGGTNRAVTVNAARLKALNLSDYAFFTIKGGERNHTVGNLTADNGIIKFPRTNSGFTITNQFTLTNKLYLDASGMDVSAASSEVSLLKLADGASGSLNSDDIVVSLPTNGVKSWAASKSANEIKVFPLNMPASVTVAYDAANNTTTPTDLTSISAAEWPLVTKPYKVTLSDTLALTETTNRLEVMKFDSALNIAASDFVIDTPKTCDLPNAWLETVAEGGVTKLILVARPVITKGINSDFQMFSDGWSDGKTPHGGADYYIYNTGNVPAVRNANTPADNTFPGESLTIRGNILLWMRDSAELKVNLRLYNLSHSNSGFGGGTKYNADGVGILDGTVYFDSSCTQYSIKSDSSHFFVIRSKISGCPSAPAVLAKFWSSDMAARVAFEGDNSGFTYDMRFYGGINAGKIIDLRAIVSRPEALGGARPSADKIGIQFNGFPMLIITNDVDYATVNRQFFADHGLQLNVADGATFTLRQNFNTGCYSDSPLYLGIVAGVEKTGAGTFAFAGTMMPWSDWHCNTAKADGTNNLVRLKEGAVKPLAAGCFDKAAFEFSDGTAIRIDAAEAATADCGLRLLDCVPKFADGAKVMLVAENVPTDSAAFSVNFLTVPTDTPDLTEHLFAKHLRTAAGGFRGEVVKSSVEVGGTTYTRYSVNYVPNGLSVIVR